MLKVQPKNIILYFIVLPISKRNYLIEEGEICT